MGLLGVSKNFDGAISWYTLAAKQGHIGAKKHLKNFLK
jgi:TPR repeat protein